jgi:dihydrofolate reductase
MSRLILWNLITLDGFFEGAKSWDLDWQNLVWGEELEALSIEQLRQADALLFGRVTYQGMAAHWQTATGEVAGHMNRLPKIVFSSKLEEVEWKNTRLVRRNMEAEVKTLKLQGKKSIFVFGSGQLCSGLLEAELVDEVRLGVVPIVLGRGRTLFGRDLERVKMRLLESRSLSNGCLILRYSPRHR